MIKFDFSMSGSDNSKLEEIILQNEYTYPDILKITGEFQIVIDGNIFFSEPYFPVLEFLKDALAWIDCSDKSKEMLYSSIETEDHPLIAFLKKVMDGLFVRLGKSTNVRVLLLGRKCQAQFCIFA